jgi:hypothetical protein
MPAQYRDTAWVDRSHDSVFGCLEKSSECEKEDS